MDKYEFNIKVEQMKKMVKKGDYATAMKIADGIDWRRVRNAGLLSMVAQIYENNKQYQEAKDILLLAFDRAPIGKRLLFKLTELALKEGNVDEAESYYHEYCDLAQDDSGQHLLRYEILKEKGAPKEQLIHSLERYTNEELDEKWMYELADLYSQVGMEDECIALCDRIMLMFGLGKYVEKAMELKKRYAPLTKYQMDLIENRDKYEEKLKAVEQEYSTPANRMRRAYEERQENEEYAAQEEDLEPERRLRLRRRQEQVPMENYAVSDQDDYEEETSHRPVVRVVERSQYDENDQDDAMEGQAVRSGRAPVIRRVRRREEEELQVSMHEEAVEKHLAEEMNKMTEQDSKEDFDMGATRIMPAIKRSMPYEEEEETLVNIQKITPQKIKEMERLEAEQRQAQYEEMPMREEISETEPEMKDAYEEEMLEDLDDEGTENELEEENVLYNHIMIEASDPEVGLHLAVKALKKIQEETGEKRQAAKLSSEKLNQKGLEFYLPKLEGKNLIVYDAARMSVDTQREMAEFLQNDTSGIVFVLMDTPVHLEILHSHNPQLARYFSYIGAEKTEQVQDDDISYEKVTASGTASAPKQERYVQKQPQSSQEMETSGHNEMQESADPKQAAQEKRQSMIQKPMNETRESRPEQLRLKSKDDADPYAPVMSINDFAKYACEYAKSIDCSIAGKSLLALYERVEIMDADGVLLTKENAENLIEEVADKAEKKSLGRLIAGIFSPRYDKDGKLILKESHFIN